MCPACGGGSLHAGGAKGLRSLGSGFGMCPACGGGSLHAGGAKGLRSLGSGFEMCLACGGSSLHAGGAKEAIIDASHRSDLVGVGLILCETWVHGRVHCHRQDGGFRALSQQL
jgi:hypothetical protein